MVINFGLSFVLSVDCVPKSYEVCECKPITDRNDGQKLDPGFMRLEFPFNNIVGGGRVAVKISVHVTVAKQHKINDAIT